ncbi:MAG TPA: methyltransferase domain-containing protein [Actinomycetota bacterium]|nr:methyltransferase domain-containing protein [Actinomycetota bacterium]
MTAAGERPADRATWLLGLRRENEEQESALAPVYDTHWGQIGETHRAFVERFCAGLPVDGDVLDAACGTGKYFGLVLESGRRVLGTDHALGYLDRAHEKFPDVPTEKHDLQDLPFDGRFDGVMCADAMEFIPPEDWPVVLERFHRALRPNGRLYLTVELVTEAEVAKANAEARADGLPVVDGEVIWHDPEPYYHHYPSLDRVRTWLSAAGFAIEEELEGPWDEGYAYHHILARRSSDP